MLASVVVIEQCFALPAYVIYLMMIQREKLSSCMLSIGTFDGNSAASAVLLRVVSLIQLAARHFRPPPRLRSARPPVP